MNHRRACQITRPLGQLRLRGMRHPQPVGAVGDPDEATAAAIKRALDRFRRPGCVYVLGCQIYVVCDAYAINTLIQRLPAARHVGTYRRSVTLAQLADDMQIVRDEMARVAATSA